LAHKKHKRRFFTRSLCPHNPLQGKGLRGLLLGDVEVPSSS